VLLRDLILWVGGLGPLAAVAYGALYFAATVLLVPALPLTLGAGFLFGPVKGSILVSLASTAAAAVAFLLARTVARKKVERLAARHPRFRAFDRAIGTSGWRVVFLLRLSPLVPFSLSNYLYGLTPVRFWPYLAASWSAMLPATILFVSLGAAGRPLATGVGRTPAQWALLGIGILSTAAATVLLARRARRELERSSLPSGDRDGEDLHGHMGGDGLGDRQ
jgi:uncharacterized membrane protein YdjX (TVP38/TMEM64 family)